MSREDIDRAIRDAERFASEDRKKKELQQAKDFGESLLNQAKKAGKKLPDDDKRRLETASSSLEEALKTDDTWRIKSASDDLERILQSVGSYADHSDSANEDGAFDA